jgi:tetratricopeptide (TPR) repeat protein
VFFGRDRAIDEARRRLWAAAERGTPFLLIVGASGAGKSSLARAGLIPRLITPGVVTSVGVWRIALMKPSEGRTGALAPLATALFAALPELRESDFPTPGALADHLRHGSVAAPIVRALARIGEAAQRELHTDEPLRAGLVLLVDQLEDLFAEAVSNDERAAFAESLKGLIATGKVWAIATLRADFYELMLKQPILKAMKEAGASLDLGPPGAVELAEIVRTPAAAAGFAFEVDARARALDERVLADAKTADSLPLLQFTLRQLYERRVVEDGQTRLTHAAYEALGGLQGAIAAEAERAVAGLPPKTLDALPRLLRRLAEPGRNGKSLTLREMAQADVAAEPDEIALVGALLGARILIAGTDAAGNSTLRLAHEAVFATWPRAAAVAQASREFYRVRAEVEEGLRIWREHNRPKDRLIQPGVPLAEADKLVADFGPELPGELKGYVAASLKRGRARQRMLAAAAVFFFCLTVIATGAGIWAVVAERHALAERDKATRSFKLAQQTAESLVFDIARGLRDVEGMRAESVRKILSTAAATFDLLAASSPDDLDLQRSRSVMLNEFGGTYLTLGDLAQALKSYRDGLAIAERLAKTDAANTGWQHDLGVSYEKVGDAQQAQGNRGEALTSYRESLAVADRLAKADPANTDWQRDLAVSHEKIGEVLQAQGNVAEALRSYRDSLAVFERLGMLDPSNMQPQRDLAVAYDSVGDMLKALGNPPEALTSYRDSLAIRERLAKVDPANTGWQRDLAVSYGKIGDALQAQGSRGEALTSYRDSLAVAERLAKTDPSNTEWQRDLAVSYDKIGKVLVDQGSLEEALNSYRNSVAGFERLAKVDSSNMQWQSELSRSFAKVGDVRLAQGNLGEALRSYRDSLAAWKHMAAVDPSNTQWQHDLQSSIERVGALAYRFVLAGDFTRALECVDQAISLAPDKTWFYANRAHALMYLGRVDEARVLYLRYRGEKNVQDDKSWETVVVEDFAELRSSGLSHPLMDEIEREFANLR